MEKKSNQKSRESSKPKAQSKPQTQKSSTEFAKEICPKQNSNKEKC
ncbi:hypothetical protein [Pelosinus sp. sgz500959]